MAEMNDLDTEWGWERALAKAHDEVEKENRREGLVNRHTTFNTLNYVKMPFMLWCDACFHHNPVTNETPHSCCIECRKETSHKNKKSEAECYFTPIFKPVLFQRKHSVDEKRG